MAEVAGKRERVEKRVGKTITALTGTARQFEVTEVVGREVENYDGYVRRGRTYFRHYRAQDAVRT